MTLIVDASVAAKWYLAETGSDMAQQLVEVGHDLIAPDLLLVEVDNTLFKAWLRGAIDDAHMDRSLAVLPSAFSSLWPIADLVADAMVISRILQHPVYDCIYLALAWRTGARIVTADERFVEKSRTTSWETFLLHLRDAI
jgi:predicted nucleic acid-binding protein